MSPTGRLIVAGVRLDREAILALAGMLSHDGSDSTARILLDALTLRREFAALTTDDKERILGVLDRPSAALTPLRERLFDELVWRRSGLVPPPRPRGIADAVAEPESGRARVAWV